MNEINYQNKVALNENPEIADINKVTDSDMNEIKSVVNGNSRTSSNNFGLGTNTWTSSATYSIGDIVVYNDNTYKNLTGTNTTTTPDQDNTNWEVMPLIVNEYNTSTKNAYSCDYINNQLDNKQNGVWTLLQDNVDKQTNVDLSNIDFNEIYVVIRNSSDNALAITQNVIKSDLTDTIKWYRNGYYYNAQVNSAVAVRASLTQISFTDYYVNGSIANAKMTVYYR